MEEENDKNPETTVAPALISVHPTHKFVSAAVGSDLRVFNLQESCVVTLADESGGHKDSIRAIRYSANGQLFVSAGDDKLVKIWATDSWRCIYSVASEKRVSAVGISNDGMFVCFADKFGVMYVVDIEDHNVEDGVTVIKKGVPILSHYCSIITRLEFSPDGRFIVSSDRDFKIRVTVFPKNPVNGAHEIQSFCLGHTEFVSCLTFVGSQKYPLGLLVSGSGDSTVRLWDHTSGSLLDTCYVGAQAEFLPSDGKEEDILPAVTDLCATPDGSLVAVAIQSLPGLMLLRCNQSSKTLSVAKVVSIPGETFIPTSIGAASSAPVLWMVMGASGLHVSESASLARVRGISGFSTSASESLDLETLVLEDAEIPGGELLLQTLQGKLSIGKEAFSAAAEAVKTAMRNLLIKKQYSAERREFRKRGRNDMKGKQ
ncbi:tRNA (guanine-N(7)-)-methyltransferase non-catalytic subunit wdr4 isoform X2 [Olea europaea var. sylvestris]|uniref:tRNA (guanine-N(7)-)-methyltransferase non-catalytic subunit n=1 Tax=Olea europaea subsp. europaea TaxID=158383 RepID=A0A8S0VBI3_OLEEU|nr:tRNA (guanine-N(7)-)-methyltransferase non-catalytic subunit wdr4 isoform X2 [Olea europaea var. sylvestris]CAA3028425.1 tRNA (guanine-N(7)-)-methyltransferase non-catalytic subunit wdr4 [Olea europaea subsp. europaea]